MHEHNSVRRLAGLALALLVAVGIGAVAYQSGVSHGLALQIPAGAAPAAPGAAAPFVYYPYWYRPWGFGFFGPFVFILFWIFIARACFWGGRRRWYYMHGGPSGFDEWHRRAHQRMNNESPTTNV